jgi:hypothetical protein
MCRPQVVNESLNPVWNQTFDFVVEDGLHDMLMLEVYDHDTFSRVSSIEAFIVVLSEYFFNCDMVSCLHVKTLFSAGLHGTVHPDPD